MKKIFLIVIIFFVASCSYQDEYSYEVNMPNNSIRFIRKEEDTSVLIKEENTYYLLILNKPNINMEVDYLIKYKNIETNIDSEEEYLLEDTLSINKIQFKKNDKIEIKFNNKNICIYVKELDKNNYNNCDFIYLYNIDDNFYITLNSNLLGLFYHSYTKFNYKFLLHLATVWIDSYTFDKDSYTTLILEDKDFIVTSTKIKIKTIHKK